MFQFFNQKIVNLKNKTLQDICNNHNLILGLSKQDVKHKLGLSFNDINSNVWMYSLREIPRLFRPNYLYIIFKENKVEQCFLHYNKTTKYFEVLK